MSSSRLPGKTIMPFFGNLSIIEIIIKRILLTFPGAPVFLLTTCSSADDLLVERIKDYPVTVFRGSENDVLERFVRASEAFQVTDLIRVCGDNPFLLPQFLKELYEHPFENLDYLSFIFDGTPVMKCHFGLFAERIRSTALAKAAQLTDLAFYHEHVTNFIYEHPDKFLLHWLDKTPQLMPLRDFRLTVDTKADFETAQQLVRGLKNPCLPEWNEILHMSKTSPEMIASMKNQIKLNSK